MHSEQVFIVYAYCPEINPTKMIIGTYFTEEEAHFRQKSFGVKPISRISPGVYRSTDNYISFINKQPIGDSCIELFTTKVV